MREPVLLSLDEAQDLFGRSAIRLVESVGCDRRRLARLLAGRGSTAHLAPTGRAAALEHRRIVESVDVVGLAWVMDDQIQGASPTPTPAAGPSRTLVL